MCVGEAFGKPGIYMPHRVLFVAKPERWPGGILDVEPWAMIQLFIDSLVGDLPGTTIGDFEGCLVMGGKPVPFQEVQAALDPASPPSPDLTALKFYLGSQTTVDHRMLYITVVQTVNPYR